MKRQSTALLCITFAFALGCSKDRPAQSAYETQGTERPSGEDPLTPASSDTVDHSQRHDASPASATAAPDTSMGPDTIPGRSGSESDRSGTMGSGSPSAQGPQGSQSAPANDVSGQRGSGSTDVTVGDQGQTASDLDVTQRIRQAVMKDSTLSFTAKNVKIVTRDGKVTLRGTVPSYEERQAIEQAAKNVAGATNVTSEIEVKK